jgi:S1-C subfamily serine protease
MKYRIVCLLIITIMIFANVPDIYAQQNKSVSQIIDQYGKAIVLIATLDEQNQIKSTGSGFIVRPNGVIITNCHVIEDANQAYVKLTNGDQYNDISIIDIDPIKDIAIIKIKAVYLPTVIIGNSNNNKIGDEVIVIGNPEGLENTVSSGLLSGIRDSEKGFKWHQISAPISHGSSGSPVFNNKGEVVGIATASFNQGQNLNFSIPINYASPLISDIPKMSLSEYSKMTTEKLLNKMINAWGGVDAKKSIQDSITVYINYFPNAASRSTVFRKGNKVRIEIETGNNKVLSAYDGENGWFQLSSSQEPQVMPSVMLEEVKKDNPFYNKFLDAEKLGIKYEFLGKQNFQGGIYLVLEQKYSDGTNSVLYIDPDSFLVQKIKNYSPTLKQEIITSYSDYRKVNNLVVAFKTTDNNGLSTSILNIVVNSGLSDNLFTMPKK